MCSPDEVEGYGLLGVYQYHTQPSNGFSAVRPRILYPFAQVLELTHMGAELLTPEMGGSGTDPDVRVRVRASVIQVQRAEPSVGTVVPIPTTIREPQVIRYNPLAHAQSLPRLNCCVPILTNPLSFVQFHQPFETKSHKS